MIFFFYALPLWKMVLFIILGVIIWGLVGRVCCKDTGDGSLWHVDSSKVWIYINCGLAILWTAFILYMTIFNRSTRESELVLIPFTSFIEAREQPEFYREMLANVMLFVPLGAWVANGIVTVIYRGRKEQPSVIRVIATTVLIGLILSIGVEAVQYILSLGKAEIDDVITNTLGTAVGAMSCWIAGVICPGDSLEIKNE